MDLSALKYRFSSPWPAYILIILTVVIIYGNIYDHQFVFDDVGHIKRNPAIRDLQNYFSFEQILIPRALVDGTFALNYQFGELKVFGYHLVNVIIHILNGILVYFLALNIFRHFFSFPQSSETLRSGIPQIPLMALSAALIFVAHPLQTQAVTYTVQRYASMAAFFYMASILFYIKARLGKEGSKPVTQTERGNWRVLSCYVLSAFCGMAAFLSKENTASLPAMILLVEYLLVDRTWKGWKKKIPWFFLAFILWVLFVFIVVLHHRETAQISALFEDVSGHVKATERATRWQYHCTQFNVIVIYIRLLFLPIHQNLDYAYAFNKGFFKGFTPIVFLFLIGLIFLGVKTVKKQPVISLGIFWFFITLSVESSVIPIKDALFEHRLYLPMFGFALIAATLLFSIFHLRPSWAIVLSVIIILTLGTATFRRNRVWHDGITLWSDVVSKNPRNWRGRTNLGLAMQNEDWLEMAIEQYEKALRLNPDYQFAHHNLANALQDLGQIDKAVAHYEEALRINPEYAFAHNNLGLALEKLGHPAEAV